MVNSYLKQTGIILLSLSFMLGMVSCKKNASNYSLSNIKLEYTEQSNGIKLNWDKLNTTDFIRYEVYRSVSPIPDPTPDIPINNNLLIATISNSEVHSFVDSTAIGQNYYRIQVVLKMRKLLSNQISISNGISIIGSFNDMQFSEDLHRMYLLNSSNQMTVFNTVTDKIEFENIFVSGNRMSLSKNQSNEISLFISSNTGDIKEYDAVTMTFKKTHLIPTNSNNYSIKNNFLYLCAQDSLVTYDLSNDSKVDVDKISDCMNNFISSTGNALIVTGFSTLDSARYFEIGSNHLPVKKYSVLDNTYYIYASASLSPMGNYLSTYQSYILDKNFSFVSKLTSSFSLDYTHVVFTNDEKYLVGRNFQHVDIYSCGPVFELKQSITSNSNGTSLFPVSIDGNQIIFLEGTFDGLTGKSITVVRKKTFEF